MPFIKILLTGIIFIILVFLGNELNKKYENKKTFIIFCFIILLTIPLNVFFINPFSEEIEELFSPKPDVEIFLNDIETIYFSDIPSNKEFRVSYLSGCQKSKQGTLIIDSVENIGKERNTHFISGLNTIGRGCDECGYYEISYLSFGEKVPDSIKIFGNFETNKFILKKIITYTNTVSGETSIGSNSFVLSKDFIDNNNQDKRMATIITKEKAKPKITTCLVDNKEDYCNITIIKLNTIPIDRNKYHSIPILGKEIILPPLSEDKMKFYEFNDEAMKFKENENLGGYTAGEGNLCY